VHPLLRSSAGVEVLLLVIGREGVIFPGVEVVLIGDGHIGPSAWGNSRGALYAESSAKRAQQIIVGEWSMGIEGLYPLYSHRGWAKSGIEGPPR
jgi:hypothetical protein